MTKKISFTKYEHQVIPNFRQKMNHAESTEDVKKFFSHTVKELLQQIFEEKIDFRDDDVVLAPDRDPQYTLSNRLISSVDFTSLWNDSDLQHLIKRLAESAIGRYKHLEKHPEKTDAKIRM